MTERFSSRKRKDSNARKAKRNVFNNEEISFLTAGNTLLLSPLYSKQNFYIRLY
jgi:hypothetical protein